MKISEQWLREWVSPKLDRAALAETLTMAGLEVASVEPVAPDLKKIVVGNVLSVSNHPQADQLKVCKVDAGKTRPLIIVCGATNVMPGIKVPVALVGARLASGTIIRSTEIRGQKSAGMLCSAAELGLEDAAQGLLILEGKVAPGQAIVDVLGLDDYSIEIDLTPNRGDCLSVAGIARELSALTGARLKEPKIAPMRARSKRSVSVRLRAKKDCPHYVGRVIEAIDPKAVTPWWMKERLRRSGLHAIHPVVDVINYVMLELGQPMHAFDQAKLAGGIVVRRAREDERLTLLDGNEIKTTAGTLLIADKEKPLALAGIMGGVDSAVGDETVDIFLESAFFQPEAIAGRARSLGLHTDSSHRFERGVYAGLQRRAVERATTLLLQIVGGIPGPVVEQSAREHLPKRRAISLRPGRVERLLGLKLPENRIETILTRLGMVVRKTASGWRVTPPGFRFDIEREVDLIEEIGRIVGYNALPSRRPLARLAVLPVPETHISDARIRTLLVDRDYQEVVTYSFVDPGLQRLLDPTAKPVMLANPISADMAAMRTTLWPGLIQTLIYNQNRQQSRIRLVELGNRFFRNGRAIAQTKVIAGAAMGPALPKQWGAPVREADFFDLKGDVEALLRLTGAPERFVVTTGEHSALQPGQTAEIRCHGRSVGLLGALHPVIQAKLGVDRPVLLFEIDISALQGAKLPVFQPVSRFPAIRRDLDIVLAEWVSAQQVLDCIKKAAGGLLVNLELFDEYRGEGIDSGRKSLTLGLTLQDSSRTLKEEAVEAVIERVVGTLVSELAAQLRQ